jgi:biotin synthase
MRNLIEKLKRERILTHDEFKALLFYYDDYLYEQACAARREVYGNEIYLRGLIEFTNYCGNDCLYCGLRRSNANIKRYRMTGKQILQCCAEGYEAGFRTFVLQGGEDEYYTDEIMGGIVRSIKAEYPDCAVTLSLGERSRESLKLLREAGADRYLLRQETSCAEHFSALHPAEQTLEARQKCLRDLKALGFQTGCGFMVGSPGQTLDNIVGDLCFIRELDPEMAGIGPFIPHSDTPLAGEKAGNLSLTLNVLAIVRLIKPSLLIPATTALGTIHEHGRELGVAAGANVIMLNISPASARENYTLYDNKVCYGEDVKSRLDEMARRIRDTGCEFVTARGDYINV